MTTVPRASLRQVLDDAIAEAASAGEKLSLKDLTVLSPQVDPFRLDTPANHRDGEWLGNAAATLGLLDGERQIHLRGLHYAISMAKTPFVKPNGQRYVNDLDNWLWLSEEAAKAARWLGYIGFDRIFDRRNATPVVRRWEPSDPTPYLSVGIEVDIPDATDLAPEVGLDDYDGAQPYKLVMIGEKASLDEGLSPIAAEVKADLYLPTGNISDTLVHQIAKVGAEDGRPMVVLYFSDCDPSGWHMPIEVGRKLQAFKETLFSDLDFRCYRALLTPDQVRTLGLPSAPLKDTERRGDKWTAAMGTAQTEVDALTTPSMERTLRRLARAAVAPFYDQTLDRRVMEARSEWLTEAQAALDEQIDDDHLDQVRAEASEKLAELRAEIDRLNEALRIDVDEFDLPGLPAVPEPVTDEYDQPMPLLDSGWSHVDQTRALVDSKRYLNGSAS